MTSRGRKILSSLLWRESTSSTNSNRQILNHHSSYSSLKSNKYDLLPKPRADEIPLSMKTGGPSSEIKPPYAKHSDFLLPKVVVGAVAEEEEEEEAELANKRGAITTDHSDWLFLAESRMEDDLSTTTKELELIESLLEDLEARIAEKRPSLAVRDQRILLGACRAYSGSRRGRLQERLGQVKFWLNNNSSSSQKKNNNTGRRAPPEGPPEEWRLVDLEWRRWLNKQAAARRGQHQQQQPDREEDPENEVAWRAWGPLAHILTSYIWCCEH
ncbi:hypothetical protein F4809DRAFT_662298 [Biscogniauxia mediterranea]|nr:hypothetical protein F4809DRAFT_662298 [Biscogniauxia mediterranea]